MRRRKFIQYSLTAAAGFSIVPATVFGRGRRIPPSDKLTKAIIGVGGMGREHIPYEDTPVIAICDVDKRHIKKAMDRLNPGVKIYEDYRELLLNKDVDIVHIATPPHWHGIMSVDAAKAGKDIWCENHW